MEKTTENITNSLLKEISGKEIKDFKGAYNIRVDCGSIARQSSENIKIETKKDNPGMDIIIKENTKGEEVYIPACVTHTKVEDLVYNDFYVGENADVTIIAGCGVHTETGEPARHNGIHRFFLKKNSRVLYLEKHVGTGVTRGQRNIDPVTEVYQEEDYIMEMDTSQLGGVDSTERKTRAFLEKGASLIIKEHLLTDGEQKAVTDFYVEMNGDNSSVNLVSFISNAKERSGNSWK